MSNISDEDTQNQDLAFILTKCITKELQKYRGKRSTKMDGNTFLTPIQELEENGKTRTTKLVLRETISFSFPQNLHLSQLTEMNLLSSKLQDWVIEKRQRESKICDTTYIHPGSHKKFRSIRQIVNYILPEENTKIPARERKDKRVQGGTSTTLSITPSSVPETLHTSANEGTNKCQQGAEKNMNEISFWGNGSKSTMGNDNSFEVRNVSMENFLSLPEVKDDIPSMNEPFHDFDDYDWKFDF